MTDDLFESLRQKYRERAVLHAATLEQALASGDRIMVTTVAHKLHGSGASFGFPQVTDLARPLEAAVEEGAADEALRSLAEPLLAELQQIAQAV